MATHPTQLFHSSFILWIFFFIEMNGFIRNIKIILFTIIHSISFYLIVNCDQAHSIQFRLAFHAQNAKEMISIQTFNNKKSEKD